MLILAGSHNFKDLNRINGSSNYKLHNLCDTINTSKNAFQSSYVFSFLLFFFFLVAEGEPKTNLKAVDVNKNFVNSLPYCITIV